MMFFLKSILIKSTVILFTAILLVVFPFSVLAIYKKTIVINSDPPNAQVFRLILLKREELGNTPFDYHADFFSENSMIRILIKKEGYSEKIVEITAKTNVLNVELEPQEIAISTGKSKNAIKGMHEKTELLIKEFLGQQLSKLTNMQIRELHLSSYNGLIYLVLPIHINRHQKILNGGHKEILQRSKTAWNKICRSLVIPLSEKLVSEKHVEGIITKLYYSQNNSRLKLNTAPGIKYNYECVGGWKTIPRYDMCASRKTVYYGNVVRYDCVGAYKPLRYFDKCAEKKLKVKPSQKMRFNYGLEQYAFQIKFIFRKKWAGEKDEDVLFEKIGKIVTDQKGKELLKTGLCD